VACLDKRWFGKIISPGGLNIVKPPLVVYSGRSETFCSQNLRSLVGCYDVIDV
jgi:hypothetical protein